MIRIFLKLIFKLYFKIKMLYILLLVKLVLGNNYTFKKPEKIIFQNHKNSVTSGIKKFHFNNKKRISDTGSFTYQKWSCPIAFSYGSALFPERIDIAIDYIQKKTGWTFVERTSQTDYIEFIDDDGCWSYLGKQGGKQEIGLSLYCDQGAVIHEIGHAIGLHHEQTRMDRDNFVTINFDNIPDDVEGNFQKSNAYNWGNYDYGSIMHYGKWDFAINDSIKTITPTGNTNGFCYIGQRFELSDNDVLHLTNLFDNSSCASQEETCFANSIKLCGVNSEVNGLDLIFGEYELVGLKNKKNKYRSKWKFLDSYFYVYWAGSYWVIEFEYNLNQYAFSLDTDLLSATWYQYNFASNNYETDPAMIFNEINCTSSPTPLPTSSPTTSESNKFNIIFVILMNFLIFILII